MILIVAEHANGKLSKNTYEICTAAQLLSPELPLQILVLGSQITEAANQASGLPATVLVADRPELSDYDPEVWSAAVAQVATEGNAKYVLIAGSRTGREYSPRVAVKLGAALLEDVTTLRSESGTTFAERYAYLARVTEAISTASRVVVTTIKPGAYSPAPSGAVRPDEQVNIEISLPKPRVRVLGRRVDRATRVSLQEADIVVSGGRGVGSAEAFTCHVEALADQLGAAVGATRAVVDAGWRPYAEQVGQTGKTVQPKAYLALGISGAVQHLSGMNKSKFILAINKDADCPIFKIVDLGVVGKVEEIVPALIRELQK
jgi:electron transfer flavoprotein alpha subunit